MTKIELCRSLSLVANHLYLRPSHEGCNLPPGSNPSHKGVPKWLKLIPIIAPKHEAVPQTGSYEVRFSDEPPSVYFYWDDIPGRRLSPEQMDSNRALEAAKALARSERDKER